MSLIFPLRSHWFVLYFSGENVTFVEHISVHCWCLTAYHLFSDEALIIFIVPLSTILQHVLTLMCFCLYLMLQDLFLTNYWGPDNWRVLGTYADNHDSNGTRFENIGCLSMYAYSISIFLSFFLWLQLLLRPRLRELCLA